MDVSVAKALQGTLSNNDSDAKHQSQEKKKGIFYSRISQMAISFQCVYHSQNLLKVNMQSQRSIPNENSKNQPPSFTFSEIRRTFFPVVLLQSVAMKCTTINNARALLFSSLNLFFLCVLAAVAAVDRLSRSPVLKHIFGIVIYISNGSSSRIYYVTDVD